MGRTNHVSFLFTVFLTQHCALTVAASCGYIKGSDGYYYRFVKENNYRRWDEAQAVCQNENAQLAIYSSDAIFEYIKDTYAVADSQMWMGARYNDSISKWQWLDQSIVEDKYWGSDYDAKSSGCGLINPFATNKYLLSSDSCNSTYPFLCQKTKSDCMANESAVSTCGVLSTNISCDKPYHCYFGAAQHDYDDGHDISIRRTESLEECAKYCCQVPAPNCQCVGFDWSEDSKQCALSGTLRSAVSLKSASRVYSCELIEVPTGYVKGCEGAYFKLYTQEVDWDAAWLQCKNDKANLVEIDSLPNKIEYLVTAMEWRRFWTRKECRVVDFESGSYNFSIIQPCDDTYPFVCEIPMTTVEEGGLAKWEESVFEVAGVSGWSVFPLWAIGLGIVVLSI